MDQVVQRSLKSEILMLVNELNQDNNELLLWLHKVNEGQLQSSPQLSEKLEKMKSEIKQKIRSISTNFEQLYKIMDFKIVKIIKQLNEGQFSKSNNNTSDKVDQLQKQLFQFHKKDKSQSQEIEKLRSQNVALTSEIKQMKKKLRELSVQRIDLSQKGLKEYNQLSQRKKHENSFSSALANERTQYGLERKKQQTFKFGCIPVKQKLQDSSQSFHESNNHHRLQFLINNLGGQSSTSISNSSDEKSVLSNHVVKKYHI